MQIDLPLPVKISTNVALRKHWAKRNEIVREFHKAMLQYKGIKVYTPALLSFTFTFKGKVLDWTNCSFMAKSLEDGMVNARMLPNDTPDYVFAGIIKAKKGDRDSVRIETL